ncbi:hypothetical protein SADUNF_Sadunf16G0192400 [Salix dunnii]|uniref:Retrotransposon gag domain-containing protein n=1 Tax=Salix dunnii TaxID=1413687 RepID=A0A835J9M8_9ROSI|nr:hypothetical protein SADUNF_Sadunf16G0192400 [Salix dunnii]
MEARVTALEALGTKNQLLLESNQLLLESLQRFLEDKFTSIDKRFESIKARFEGSVEKEGECSRRRGVIDPREKEKGYPSDNRMPFIKMDFPRFNEGDDPIEWISVPPEKKDFTKAFCKEFGPHGFEDFAEEFFKLRQTGTLKDYIAEFRKLATRIRDLTPTLRLSCFIGGLREVIRHDVKLLRPATVHEAMSFAHEVEAKFQKLRLVHSSGNFSSRSLQSPLQHDVTPARTRIEPTTGKDMSFKKLTPEEVQFKRQNNLCFYCDEKFVRGHKCAGKQVLLLDMGYNSSDEEELAQETQPNEQITEINACCITACALYGIPAPSANKTMKITATIKNCVVIVLLDSGSSHNLIHVGMVKRLGWKLDPTYNCEVMIADGGQVPCKGSCAAVPLTIGRYGYTSDMFALQLGGCDIVLGVQWLRTLSPVLWDFEALTMKFWCGREQICLSSARPQSPLPISCQQMDKLLLSGCYGVLLCAIEKGSLAIPSPTLGGPADELSSMQQQELQALLNSFAAIFGTPKSLPPPSPGDIRATGQEVCEPPMQNLAITYPYHSWMDDLRRFNEGDPWINSKKQQVLALNDSTRQSLSQPLSEANHLTKFHIDNGLLKYKSIIVLSPGAVWIAKLLLGGYEARCAKNGGGMPYVSAAQV